ncbi:bifunctional ornithine acetyltransferase/N-acetylglutamate synthase [Methanoplanus endosymbiosus]|uniref:Glutamate N-acetyltransferase n=1 Tax=Methanoplanus endosymbiosus TaxID=33865 RepID=A0A9E7PK70_9EURY|nr:bifunctional ornithine acetyltransferase/N-acetylglutamate synthase [Methanoplanus endosymbiosus]UUX91473.1 bifunctional ornithine acetyltransferase/N-acetylglutamate synthase [Methanoplanus endosymbiosus]
MKSICAVKGVTAAGIKEGRYGLALIKASGNAAAVFTRNLLAAEPVHLMRERMKSGYLDGIIVNSGNANVYTGEQGLKDAERMAELAAEAFGTTPEKVGVASTGVIGRFMRMEIIEDQFSRIRSDIRPDEKAEDDAESAIMTTDTKPKHAVCRREGFTVAGITKGSGMIAPNMGTMLAFIYTDAEAEAEELSIMLKKAVDRSFNRVVVDGDTSTNDCAFFTATGIMGRADPDELYSALEEVCVSLAKQIASDGEGATKMLEITVINAASEEDAADVAKTVVESPLVKTAVYGEDPNWGRVIASAGRAGVHFDTEKVSVYISDGEKRVPLAVRGEITADDIKNPDTLKAAKDMMAGETVTFVIDLDSGSESATAWGCDLTEKYVEINGKYTT